MSSASTDPLPTFTISPPPLLLPSAHAHETTIEPASIAISAVIATLVLALLILSFTNKRNNSNSTANKSETKSTPRPLRISGPLGLEHPGDATLQHVPSTTTNPPLYDKAKWPSGTLNESMQTKAFDNLPPRQTTLYPAYTTTTAAVQPPIELEALHPTAIYKPYATYHRTTQPLPLSLSPARQSRKPMTIPRRPLRPASDFADGSAGLESREEGRVRGGGFVRG
ncbi:hypothetical protein PTNB85_09358 [Pyrenophora teres f. teres]|nr:hypothetical protein PTNB85_09358 [Pyrenophora teres f. teres]KAE8835295.1 hypothetical protein HRS9122_07565 [Pyrenophora teres f. teres]